MTLEQFSSMMYESHCAYMQRKKLERFDNLLRRSSLRTHGDAGQIQCSSFALCKQTGHLTGACVVLRSSLVFVRGLDKTA